VASSNGGKSSLAADVVLPLADVDAADDDDEAVDASVDEEAAADDLDSLSSSSSLSIYPLSHTHERPYTLTFHFKAQKISKNASLLVIKLEV